MSHLRLFRPDDCPSNVRTARFGGWVESERRDDQDGEPDDRAVILSFSEWAPRLRASTSPLRRQQALARHSRCPECDSPVVFPLHLNDARPDSGGHSLPGSSSLVGFHCDCCQHEWPCQA